MCIYVLGDSDRNVLLWLKSECSPSKFMCERLGLHFKIFRDIVVYNRQIISHLFHF